MSLRSVAGKSSLLNTRGYHAGAVQMMDKAPRES